MSPNQQKYLEEVEKYKSVVIEPGLYLLKNTSFHHQVISIENEIAIVKTVHSELERKKTLHWCRKNLVRIS